MEKASFPAKSEIRSNAQDSDDLFPATGGFTLPDRAMKAADVSYFTNERLAALTPNQLDEAFPPIAPNVAFELMSPEDTLTEAKAKVESYIATVLALVSSSIRKPSA